MSKYRCMILEMMDDGLLDPKPLVEALVGWLSEADAKKFYETYFENVELKAAVDGFETLMKLKRKERSKP